MENIVISDPEGQLIPSSQGGNGDAGATTTFQEQLNIKRQIEADIRENVEKLLRPIMGQDAVVASVFATINFDKKNSVEQLVTPVNLEEQSGIAISLQEVEKSFSSEGAGGSGGIVGTGTEEIMNYPSADATGGSTESEESERIVNYEVNRITNEIVSSPYAIMDLTINVAIEPPDPSNPESLTTEMRESVERLLMNIVGAALANNGETYSQEELGQKVLVVAQPFLGKEGSQAAAGEGLSNAWWFALGGVALALLAVGGYALARRRRAEQYEEEQLESFEEVDEESIDLENLSHETRVRKQLDTLARKKPEEFVNLLRTWLVDE